MTKGKNIVWTERQNRTNERERKDRVRLAYMLDIDEKEVRGDDPGL
jgi:hypothetical protein